MSELSNGRITKAYALAEGSNLIIYVEGVTAGFGGSLVVRKMSSQIMPTQFNVHENPGNMGIIPTNGPTNRPTSNAYLFKDNGFLDSIILNHSQGRDTLKVVKIKEAENEKLNDNP